MDNLNRIPLRILVVDNEPAILEAFTDTLELTQDLVNTGSGDQSFGIPLYPDFEVITCQQPTNAVALVRKSLEENNPFALAFLDIQMESDKDGIWVAQKIRSLDQEIEMVMMTESLDFGIENAISSVLPSHKTLLARKPLYPQEIYQFSVSLVEKWKTEKELKSIKKDLEQKVERQVREVELLSKELKSDTEERKSIEEDLKRLRFAIDLSGESVFIINPKNGRILDVNKRACVELGYDYDELIKLSIRDIEAEFDSDEVYGIGMEHVRNNLDKYLVRQGRHIRKDGTTFPVEVTGLLKSIGNRAYLLTTVRDVSQWQKIADELTASKAHLAFAKQIANLGSWELAVSGKVLHWSDETYRIFGLTPQTQPTDINTIGKRIHPEDIDNLLETANLAIDTKSSFDATHRLIFPDNEVKYIRIIGKVLCDETGKSLKLVGTAQDITQRRLQEDEMKKMRNLLTSIINSMPSILIGVDVEGKITQWNKAAQVLTGISPLKAFNNPLGKVFSELSLAADMVKQAILKRETLKETKVQVGKGNKNSLFNITVYPLIDREVEGAVILVEDVTERARMDEIMLQTEKMFTIGGLAAGMAHEINSPLAGIIQNLQVMRRRLSAKHPKNADIAIKSGTTIEKIEEYFKQRNLYNTIDKVLEAGHRAAKIVENMLNFSYKAGTIYSKHNLAELMDKTIELANNEFDLKKRFDFKKIKIIKEYNAETPMVPCEGNTIQQVFLNILKNGAQAMSSGTNVNNEPCFHLRVVPEPEFVRVEIEDNGPGIDEQTKTRIFEPFFTTKEAGVGTGLGLAVCYFIITENHGGTISVDSNPGKGAVFAIRLPV